MRAGYADVLLHCRNIGFSDSAAVLTFILIDRHLFPHRVSCAPHLGQDIR
jgi:hypothetical protein